MKLEEANMDIETLKAQRDAAKALSSIHKEMYVRVVLMNDWIVPHTNFITLTHT